MSTMDMVSLMTKALAVTTLIGNTGTLFLLLAFFVRRSLYASLMSRIAQFATPLGFLLAAASTFGSLLYSEVAGFPACVLCWIQRIFMYPLTALFLLAVWRRENIILPYTLFLSILGGGVALYQWVKDMVHVYTGVIIPCPAVSGLPSCDTIYINEFGYITIPMLALNAFILIGIISWAGIYQRRVS